MDSGLQCQGLKKKKKSRSVLWSLVPLRYGQQTSIFSSPISLKLVYQWFNLLVTQKCPGSQTSLQNWIQTFGHRLRKCCGKYSKYTQLFWPRLCWHDTVLDVPFSYLYKNILKWFVFLSPALLKTVSKMWDSIHLPSCRTLLILKLLNLSFYSGMKQTFEAFFFLSFFSWSWVELYFSTTLHN